MMKIVGVIVRRRVLGKNLAFCHVQRQETQQQQEEGELKEDGAGAGDIIRVAFRRSSDAWDSTRDETFPTKVSRLPYGAMVLMELQSPKQQPEGQQQQQDWEVCSWQILVHPDIVAQTTSAVVDKNSAQNNDDKNVIVSVPAYLRARGQMFMDLHPEKRPKKVKKIQQEPTTATTTTITTTALSNNPHGDAHAKCQRANVFCQWLLETFGQEMLQNTTVLDVASGKGQLSIELACSYCAPTVAGAVAGGGVRCIMVDPMIRGERHDPTVSTTNRATTTTTTTTTTTVEDDDDSFQILGKRARKRIQKAGGPMPVFLAAYFDDFQFVKKHADGILQNCGLLVGLHPDQCTEAIVNVALRLQKSFAVVPCCVFGDLFPVRMLRQQRQPTTTTTATGNLENLHVTAAPVPAPVPAPAPVPVRTYEQFLQYLREKDPRIQQATLPVCGKNQVLYLQQ